MSGNDSLAVAGVALLLLLTVGAGNVVITAERTALNGDYASETLESEGFYEAVTEEARRNIESDVGDFSPEQSDQIPSGIAFSQLDAGELATDAVPASYIESQSSQNIDRLFAYLHGDRSDLVLRIDARPLKENVADAVTEQVSDVDASALLDSAPVELGDGGTTVDSSMLAQLLESESSYQQAKSDFQDQYTAQERERIASEARSEASQQTQEATAQYNQQITDGTITIQHAVIDGLATDMSYREFRSQYESGKDRIADGAGQAAADQLDQEIGDEITGDELLGPEAENRLQDASGVVQTMDALQLALPIAALLLIALLYGITRAWQRTARVTGKTLVVVGALALVVVLVQSVLLGVVENRVESQVRGNEVVGMDLVTSFVEGIFEALAVQSGLLIVLGLVLIGLVFADRRGYLDGVKQTLGASPTGTGAGGGQARQRPPQSQQPPGEQHGQQPTQPTGRSIAQQGPREQPEPPADPADQETPEEGRSEDTGPTDSESAAQSSSDDDTVGDE